MLWCTNIRPADVLAGLWPLLDAMIETGELTYGALQKMPHGPPLSELAAAGFVGLYRDRGPKWRDA